MKMSLIPARRATGSVSWLNVLTVLAVLLAAPVVAAALVMLRIDPLLPLAAMTGLVGLVMWARGRAPFQIGILAMAVAAGMLGFFTLPTGRDSRLVISLVLALGLLGYWLLSMLVLERRLTLKPSPVNRPLLFFVLANIVSYVWSQFMQDELLFVWGSFPVVQVAALLVNVVLPLVLLLAANHLDDPVWIRRFVWIMLGMGIAAVFLYLFSLQWHTFFFVRGTRGMWGMWTTVLAYALALFGKDLKPWQRLALLVFVGAQVYLYFFIGRMWVSGWAPLGLGCALVTLLRSRPLFFALLLAGSIYVGVNFDYYYQDIVVAQEEEGSGSTRVALWLNNLTHVKNHPIFGMGPAGYAPYNMTYHPNDARSTHNNYFDILAQTGIVGALLFVWLALTLVTMAFRTWQRLAGQRDFLESFSAAAFAGSIAILGGMMLGDWVLPFAYNQTISGFDNAVFTWLLLGCMVGLHRRVVLNGEQAVPDPAFAAGAPLPAEGSAA